jgi:hypothetical protein
MPESDDQPDAQLERELDALFSTLARAVGLNFLPLPNGEQEDLLPADEAAATLAEAQRLPPHHRLEVLARLIDQPQHLGSGAIADHVVATLSDSLLHERLQEQSLSAPERQEARNRLVNRLSRWKPGMEPLGRPTHTLLTADDDPLLADLDDLVQAMAFTLLPQCQAGATAVGGIPALSIETQAICAKPLSAFEKIVDPREWPNCSIQNRFFTQMADTGSAAPAPPFPSDDHGWKKVLLEVVDFGAFVPSKTDQRVYTELEFVYFFPRDPAQVGPRARAGCTYDLHHSRDGKILVDQGYLLAEDLQPKENSRRFRTLKTVHFTAGDPPAEEVCAFWSLAAGMIMQGC